MTGALAPLLLLAVRGATWWRPPRLPAVANGVGFVVLHGAITVSLVIGFSPLPWAGLHVVLLAAAVLYWVPILDLHYALGGSGRMAYTFLTAPALDLAGAAVMGLGHPAGGVAMIVGMLPLNLVALLLAWRWIRDEELSIETALAAGELPEAWLPGPGGGQSGVTSSSLDRGRRPADGTTPGPW